MGKTYNKQLKVLEGKVNHRKADESYCSPGQIHNSRREDPSGIAARVLQGETLALYLSIMTLVYTSVKPQQQEKKIKTDQVSEGPERGRSITIKNTQGQGHITNVKAPRTKNRHLCTTILRG